MGNDLTIVADRQNELLVKGMEFVRTFTRGVALVSATALQRHLSIDYQKAQWLLQQLRIAEWNDDCGTDFSHQGEWDD